VKFNSPPPNLTLAPVPVHPDPLSGQVLADLNRKYQVWPLITSPRPDEIYHQFVTMPTLPMIKHLVVHFPRSYAPLFPLFTNFDNPLFVGQSFLPFLLINFYVGIYSFFTWVHLFNKFSLIPLFFVFFLSYSIGLQAFPIH